MVAKKFRGAPGKSRLKSYPPLQYVLLKMLLKLKDSCTCIKKRMSAISVKGVFIMCYLRFVLPCQFSNCVSCGKK